MNKNKHTIDTAPFKSVLGAYVGAIVAQETRRKVADCYRSVVLFVDAQSSAAQARIEELSQRVKRYEVCMNTAGVDALYQRIAELEAALAHGGHSAPGEQRFRTLVQDIIGDGYLSDTNTHRARLALDTLDVTAGGMQLTGDTQIGTADAVQFAPREKAELTYPSGCKCCGGMGCDACNYQSGFADVDSTRAAHDSGTQEEAAMYRLLRAKKDGIEFRDGDGKWRSDCPSGEQLDAILRAELATQPLLLAAPAQPETALDQYDAQRTEVEKLPPLERLGYFCSLAMNGQDWIDSEPFFYDVAAALAAPAQVAQGQVTDTQAQRGSFEAWASSGPTVTLSHVFSFTPDISGRRYLEGTTELCWRAWRAATAQCMATYASQDLSTQALHLVRQLSGISMNLAADLVKGADYTFNGHDYLDRNAVVDRVMQWRTEWDATSPAQQELACRCRALASNTVVETMSAPGQAIAAGSAP